MRPLFINIKNWNVLVVGAGSYGSRKAQELLNEGARVTLVSPNTPFNPDLLNHPKLNFINTEYQEVNLDKMRLVSSE